MRINFWKLPLALTLAAYAGLATPLATRGVRAGEELMPLSPPADLFHAAADPGEPAAAAQPERNIIRLVVPLSAYRNDPDDQPISVKATPAPTDGSTFVGRQMTAPLDIFAVPGLVLPEDLSSQRAAALPQAGGAASAFDRDLGELVEFADDYHDPAGEPAYQPGDWASQGAAFPRTESPYIIPVHDAAVLPIETIDIISPERVGENAPLVKFVELEPIPAARHRQASYGGKTNPAASATDPDQAADAEEFLATPPLPEAVGSMTLPGLDPEKRAEAKGTAARIANKYKTHVANIPMPKNETRDWQSDRTYGMAAANMPLTATPAPTAARKPAAAGFPVPPAAAAAAVGVAGLGANGFVPPADISAATGSLTATDPLAPPAGIASAAGGRPTAAAPSNRALAASGGLAVPSPTAVSARSGSASGAAGIDFRSAFAAGFAANPDSALSIAGIPITGPDVVPPGAKKESAPEPETAAKEETAAALAAPAQNPARKRDPAPAALPPSLRLSETAMRLPGPTADEKVSAERLPQGERVETKTSSKPAAAAAGASGKTVAAPLSLPLPPAVAAAPNRVAEEVAAAYVPPPPGLSSLYAYEEEAAKKSITEYTSSIAPPSYKKTTPSRFDIMEEEAALIAKEKAEFERQKAEAAYAKKYTESGVAKGLADLAKKAAPPAAKYPGEEVNAGVSTLAMPASARTVAPSPPAVGVPPAADAIRPGLPSPSGLNISAGKETPAPALTPPASLNRGGMGMGGGLSLTGTPGSQSAAGGNALGPSGLLRPPAGPSNSLRPGSAGGNLNPPLSAPTTFPSPVSAPSHFPEPPSRNVPQGNSGLSSSGISSSGITSGMLPGMTSGLSLMPLTAPSDGRPGLTNTTSNPAFPGNAQPAADSVARKPQPQQPMSQPVPANRSVPSAGSAPAKKAAARTSTAGATPAGKKPAKKPAPAEDADLPPPLSPQLFHNKNRSDDPIYSDDDDGQGFTILRGKKKTAGKRRP